MENGNPPMSSDLTEALRKWREGRAVDADSKKPAPASDGPASDALKASRLVREAMGLS